MANKLDTLLEKGKSYIMEKKYHLAGEEFRKIIAINSNYVEAHFELGKAYYIQNKIDLAIKELEETKKISPQHIHTRLLLAKIFKSLGKFELALEEIKYILDNPLYMLEAQKELKDIYPGYIDEVRYCNFQGRHEEAMKKAKNIYSCIPENETFLRNKVLNELEMAQKKEVLDSWMRSLMVTLTTKCNLNCIMCEQRGTPWIIPEKTLKEIISLFPYLERVMWQGGESFLFDHLDDLIEEAGKFLHLKQIITTNGLLLDERWAEKLVGKNVNITFSIDGVTKEVYEKIRRGGNFDVLVRNLNGFNKLRQKYSPYINANLNVVVMKSNYHQLEDFLDFAKEYQFNLLAFLPLGGCLAKPENIFYLRDEEALKFIRRVIPKIEEKAKRYNIVLENQLPVYPDSQDPDKVKLEPSNISNFRHEGMLCHLPWIQLFIDYEGGIRPDCDCKPGERIGNVATDSLRKVWNNQKMQLYRRKVGTNCYTEICNSDCSAGRISQRYLKFF